jgi:hypothetical protein
MIRYGWKRKNNREVWSQTNVIFLPGNKIEILGKVLKFNEQKTGSGSHAVYTGHGITVKIHQSDRASGMTQLRPPSNDEVLGDEVMGGAFPR